MRQSVLAVLAVLAATLAVNVAAAPARPKVGESFSVGSQLEQAEWAGPDRDFLYLRTSNNQVYLSVDDGMTWTHESVDDKMAGSETKLEPSKKVGVAEIALSRANDGNHVFFRGAENLHWTAREVGSDEKKPVAYSKLDTHRFYSSGLHGGHGVALHPAKSDWMLGCVHSTVKGKNNLQLMYSKNFGKSWSVVDTYLERGFTWGRAGLETDGDSHHPKKKIPDGSFYDISLAKKEGNQGHVPSKEWVFRGTHNLGKTWSVALQYAQDFIVHDHFTIALYVNREPGADRGVGLYVSPDDGHLFQIAEFPFTLNEWGYTFVDMRNSLFLVTLSLETHARIGELFISDASGSNYIHSLGNVASNPSSHWPDVYALRGLEGIHIANRILNPDPSLRRFDITTVINYQNGRPGSWSPLKEVYGMDGKKMDLQEGESLHLHIYHSNDAFPTMYSTPGSPGLVIANGNVGPVLNYDEADMFLSRDAGLSWHKIHEEPHIYEFGDHGGIIVMARYRTKTNLLTYTLDSGNTWHNVTFLPKGEEVIVDNIITEPKRTSTTFIVISTHNNAHQLISVDFKGVWPAGTCKGSQTPGDAKSDYEYWSPHDKLSNCVLGKRVRYVRRKPERACYNPEDLKKPALQDICLCTQEDWECDYNFTAHGNACVAVADIDMSQPDDCEEGEVYYPPNGYRKVAGNDCNPDGGVDHTRSPRPCISRSHGGWAVLVVVFLLGASLFAFNAYKNPDSMSRICNRDGNMLYSSFSGAETLMDDDDFDDMGEPEELRDESIDSAVAAVGGGAGGDQSGGVLGGRSAAPNTSTSLVDVDAGAAPRFGIQPVKAYDPTGSAQAAPAGASIDANAGDADDDFNPRVG